MFPRVSAWPASSATSLLAAIHNINGGAYRFHKIQKSKTKLNLIERKEEGVRSQIRETDFDSSGPSLQPTTILVAIYFCVPHSTENKRNQTENK